MSFTERVRFGERLLRKLTRQVSERRMFWAEGIARPKAILYRCVPMVEEQL